jgi:S1-C subfamily serine protease
MKGILGTWVILFASLAFGCAPAVSYTPVQGPGRAQLTPREPLDPNAKVDIFQNPSDVPAGARTVGELRISDTGLSFGCGYDAVLALILDKARAEGVDGVYLVSIVPPNLRSTCYQMTARLLVYSDQGRTPPVLGEDSPMPRRGAVHGTGTGFYVDTIGHLLTNAHVLDGCGTVSVASSSSALTVVRIDKENDLAVLRSKESPSEVAVFREGRGIRSGDAVVAVGFPLTGLLANEANITTGGVSALAGIRDDFRFLQMTTPVQPGNSGGPLLDSNGRVVGVVTSKLNAIAMARATGDVPQNVNFAINASVARILLDALGIGYATAPSGIEMSAADVGALAKTYTVLLECRK